MKFPISGLAGLVALVFSLPAIAAWEPTFVDNFDGAEVDPSAWVPDREVLPRRINHYDRDAVQVSDGKLRLGVLDRPESDRPYTTGLVTTQGLFRQKYGYFEIRAKVPKGRGFWPAFWLMPTSGRWTSEIDIGEFRGHLTDTVHYAFHYGNRLRNENGYTAQLPVDLSADYNNFAVLWTPERIDYLLNGQVMHSVSDPEAVRNADSDMFLILNLALSSPHSDWIPPVNKNTDLTQAFLVDHVRVYRETPTGRYASIPKPEDPVADVRGQAYDNTALAVDRVDLEPQQDIRRSPGRITGAIEVASHKPDFRGQVSVVLTRMTDFNLFTGRFGKTASLETRNFNVWLPTSGAKQTLEYEFDTEIVDPGAYSVDVLIKDPVTQNKKSLAAHRVVQFVDSARPETTVWLEGFFREGSAAYANGAVSGSLPLQLQQALLAPYLNVRYELVDTNSGEVIAAQEERLEHTSAGLQTLTPNFMLSLDPARSVGLIVNVVDSSGIHPIPEYGVHVAGTAPPPDDWNPGAGPVEPVFGGGEIPLQNWEPTFVDNFEGGTVNGNA